MKEKLRKILIIFCAVFFAVFSTVAYPMQQAQAGPLVGAVPAGLTVGAGVYTTGALIIAGGAGLIGYDEYSEEINAHAMRAWNNGTDLAKQSLNFSIEQARGMGTGIVDLQTDFQNFIDGQLKELGTSVATIATAKEDIAGHSLLVSDGRLSFSNEAAGYGFSIDNEWVGAIRMTEYFGSLRVTVGPTIHVFDPYNTPDYKRIEDMPYNTPAQYMAVLAALGMPASIINIADWTNTRDTAVSKIRESWESMKDAGLVLPVDSAVPYTPSGNPATYNADTDTYTGIDGGVYAPADVTWSMPNVKYREKSDAIPETGVYVDTPVLTGNPAYDEAIINNPAIPHTTTNINTGTTVANPDIATPITPPITAVPPVVPPFDAPGSTGLDFTPLMMTGTAMTNKFPFSIPFDFVKQLQVLNVEPEAPSFDINVPEFLKVGGFTIPFKFKLSFEMFDPVANLIRWGLIIIFDISLIFAIRKLLPE